MAGETRKQVTVYTDGACKGNPGPGGWAAILRYNEFESELVGGEAETTNNRMELTAVIEALRALTEPCAVTIYTDSELIANCAQGRWKRKHNLDLWVEYDRAKAQHSVRFEWVRGHAGHPLNERVDKLASDQAKRFGGR